jgi:hypothetical protein
LVCGVIAAMVAGVAGQVTRVDAALPSIGPNVNISRIPGNQSETAIAIDPGNPRRLFAVANQGFGSGLFAGVSGDAGASWRGRVIADGSDRLPAACCDPSVSWDAFGNLFLVYLDANDTSVPVLLSTDGGSHFTTIATLGRGIPDQPTVTTGAGSVWITYADRTGRVVANGAAVHGSGKAKVGAFSAPVLVAHERTGAFGDIAIGPHGEVMVAWQRPFLTSRGPSTIFTSTDPTGLNPIAFRPEVAVTTDNLGGQVRIPAQPRRGIDVEASLAWDRSGHAHNGRVYLAYSDARAISPRPGFADTDVLLRFSDDNGATWSGPTRVTDDHTGRSRLLPNIALDQTTGEIALSWYDCRNDPGNRDAQLWGVTSTDGVSFSPNFRISSGSSNAAGARSFIDLGDYTHSAYQDGVFHPAWADNSNSTGDNPTGTLHQLNLYTAAVTVHPSRGTVGPQPANGDRGSHRSAPRWTAAGSRPRRRRPVSCGSCRSGRPRPDGDC